MAFDVPGAIIAAADRYGVDPGFALAIGHAESSLSANPPHSSAGAIGTMQLMPATAKGLGVADPTDPAQNIDGGVRYIAQLQNHFGADHPDLVAAAYNAGPGAVVKHGGVPPYPETLAYVQKVTGQAPVSAPGPHAMTVADFYKQTGMSPPSATDSQGQDAQPSQGAGAPAPVSVADFYKQSGLKPPGPAPINPGASPQISPAQAAANIDAQGGVQKSAAIAPWLAGGGKTATGVQGFVNSALLGAAPLIAGGEAAMNNAGQGALSAVGLAPKPQYGPGEAFTANRDAYQGMLSGQQQAHPVTSALGSVGGIVASGPADLIDRGIVSGVEHLAPQVGKSLVGRLATKGLGAAAVGGVYGADQGLSEGQSVPQALGTGVESAALTAPFGVVGGALGEVLPRLPAFPLKRAILPAAGATIGAAYGATLGGGQPKDIIGGAAAGGAMGALRRVGEAAPDVAPTAADHTQALDYLAKQTPPDGTGASPHTVAADALEQAPPSATTVGEALGPTGLALAKAASSAGGTAPSIIGDTINARQDKGAINGRIASDVQTATGIDPVTSQADIKDQVDNLKATVAKPAWDKVDMQAPTYNPTLAELSKEPEVRSALDWARRKIGTAAMADNPSATLAPDGRPVVSAADYQGWLRGGNPDTEALINPTTQPQQVPTAETWIMAQRDLASNVARDPITRQVLPDSIAGGNSKNLHWAGAVNDAIKDGVPNLAEAKAASGDYISAGNAYQNGRALWDSGKNAETSAAFADRFGGLAPGDQIATQRGYMSRLYQKMDEGQFKPGAAQTPFHQSAQETMFGPDRAAQIQATLAREQAMAASGAALQSSAKAVHIPAEEGHGGALTGAIVGAAELPHSPLIGAARGAMIGTMGKGALSVAKALKPGTLSPGARNALGHILAQEPAETARQLRIRASERRSVPLSESTLKGILAEHALRGIAVGAGQGVHHALSGLFGPDEAQPEPAR